MMRVAYDASAKDFMFDWNTNQFMAKICEGAALNHIGGSTSEKNSWSANGAKICSLLTLAKVPDDVHVVFEYKTPLTGRVDCMLFGYGKDGKKHIVHIELKQWSNDTVTQVFDTGVFQVSALVGGHYQFLAHPSQQAYNYQQNIENYVETVSASTNKLHGYAYCYNYSYTGKPNDLFAPSYYPIIEKCPLNAGDQVIQFADTLNNLLGCGEGADIFREFISSPIRPTKNLINAAANMFKGQTEFVLLDDQLTSCNMIFGMIANALANKNRKMVLIVKGGPGTGKTVVALKVLAEIASKYPEVSAFFTTRSKALRNTLRVKLNEISTGSVTSAAGLIRDIYDFKPHNFSEGEVDVLLVDEAHRITKSSNVMHDTKDEQTFLPQVISLIYCAKVSVFFIDDHQGVKRDEIGLSSTIAYSAKNYSHIIDIETQKFSKDLAIKQRKLEEATKKLTDIALAQSSIGKTEYLHQLAQLNKRIAKLNEQVAKAYQIKDIDSHVNSVEVMGIELKSQFRCNGSDNYLDWIDTILYCDSTTAYQRTTSFSHEYHFEICDSPAELERKIRALNSPVENKKQIARIVAGYCWHWSTNLQENGDLFRDVQIGDWSMPWETNGRQARKPYNALYAPSADLWASHPMGINQVGCIFSAQGFEVDYIGVILGPDILYDPVQKCIRAEKGHTHSVSDSDPDFDEHIKNIYRVLLSRGRKGCYVYCCDKALSEYLQSLLKK